MENTHTIETLTALIVGNAKHKKWLSAHFQITHNGELYSLGVKAFGRWVQRLELCGIVSNVPEQKTNKRMGELVTLELQYLFKSIGA